MALNFKKLDMSEQKFIPTFNGQNEEANPATFWLVPMNEADYSAYHAVRLRADGSLDMAHNKILAKYVTRIDDLTVGDEPNVVAVKTGKDLVAQLDKIGIDIHPLLLEVVNEIYTISTVKDAERKN